MMYKVDAPFYFDLNHKSFHTIKFISKFVTLMKYTQTEANVINATRKTIEICIKHQVTNRSVFLGCSILPFLFAYFCIHYFIRAVGYCKIYFLNAWIQFWVGKITVPINSTLTLLLILCSWKHRSNPIRLARSAFTLFFSLDVNHLIGKCIKLIKRSRQVILNSSVQPY